MKRVTIAALTSPATEYRPSCARPGKLDSSSDAKPTIEVSTPSRMVGQKSATQSFDASALLWRDCTNR